VKNHDDVNLPNMNAISSNSLNSVGKNIIGLSQQQVLDIRASLKLLNIRKAIIEQGMTYLSQAPKRSSCLQNQNGSVVLALMLLQNLLTNDRLD